VDSGQNKCWTPEAVLAILDEEKDLTATSETGDISFGAANAERRDPWALHADGHFVV